MSLEDTSPPEEASFSQMWRPPFLKVPAGTWSFLRVGKGGSSSPSHLQEGSLSLWQIWELVFCLKKNQPSHCLHFHCSPVLGGFVEKLPLSRWQSCLMTVFHAQQTSELPFVCSHYALLCTWHHLHIFNGVACGYGPFKLCLCGNHGSIYVLFQTYHTGVYQLFHRRQGNRLFTEFLQNSYNFFWNKILHEIQHVCQVNGEMQEARNGIPGQGTIMKGAEKQCPSLNDHSHFPSHPTYSFSGTASSPSFHGPPLCQSPLH